MLITRQNELETLCGQLRAAQPIALDTEFISERCYSARLCLLQVYACGPGDPVEGLIDPFSVGLAPLLELVSDPEVTKIVHSGGQDLQILFGESGRPARSVFDTQIAAAFLGYGHQIGYTELVRRVLGGPSLSKEAQYSNWAARPLSPEQMEYALDDVRYLPALFDILRSRLLERGRLTWAESEFSRAEEKAASPMAPEDLYRKLNLSGLSRRQLGALRELASVRDEIARSIDKPPSFVVPDTALIQMARQPPASIATMRSMRGMPSIPSEQANQFLAALKTAAALQTEQLPHRQMGESSDPRTDSVAALLNVVAQVRAAEQEVSRTYLAPRDQIQTLASWWLSSSRTPTPPDIPLLSDWRRQLLGAEMLDLLDGEVAITLHSHGRASESLLRVVRIK